MDVAIREQLKLRIVDYDRDILALYEDGDTDTWYAACHCQGRAFAVVVYVERDSGDWCRIKIVPETDGPTAFGAPAVILDQLTAPASEAAARWRAGCRRRMQGIPTIKAYH